MKPSRWARVRTSLILLCVATVVAAAHSSVSAPAPQSPPNIQVSGKLSPDKVKRGGRVQGTVVMEIPSGYHVNSNRPLERFLISTQLTIDAPSGIRVGPSLYPRPLLRSLKFSKNRVAVFEGRTTIRFIVTVPAGVSPGSQELKGKLRYQSCSDDFCFPPQTRDVSIWLNVE
jgi:DsbC/DsbD-like thiol-disulfide interchange protein